MLALGLLTLAVLARGPLPGEERLLREALVTGGGWRESWSTVADTTDLLPLVLVACLAAVVLAVAGHLRVAAVGLGACLVVWALNPAVKELVGRARPDVVDLPAGLSEHSFPSGHAANSAVVVGAGLLVVASLHYRRAVTVGAVAVGAVVLTAAAAAQLALGRHYPSDVLAGWLLAAAVVAAAATVVRRRTDDSG